MVCLYRTVNFLRSKSRSQRRFIQILFDYLLVNISIFVASWLVFSESLNIDLFSLAFISYSFIGLPLFISTGQYSEITSYIGSFSLYLISLRNLLFVVSYSTFIFFLINSINIFRFSIVLWLLISTFQLLFRIFIRDLILNSKKLNPNKIRNVAIYGAGSAGAQLNISLGLSDSHNVKVFIDDNKKKNGMTIGGVKVISPVEIKNYLPEIDKVFLAIPSLNGKRKREIIDFILKFNLPVMEVPTINEIITGTKAINAMKSIDINDLLYRDVALSSESLLENSISNSIVLVTGAAGSIGSEICRQSLLLNPKKLILVDHSESDLYKISNEIKSLKNDSNIEICFVLGSILNKSFFEELVTKNSVDIIFHCAAYKHVPILESNPLIGIYNNVLSTKIVCECSERAKIDKLILISTDKAVRPTNLMGATKRIAELIVQAFDYESKLLFKENKLSKATKYSIVRFGNVLESSGSVVPLFKSQIENGGPITLTHKDIVRYFMTITEAAQLVLQASSLSEGGDLFLLDMGKPILIKDLAKKMISLAGLTLKNSENPLGDIEILISGLRPGEKIREELLIDGKSIPTSHDLIYKAVENFIKKEKLMPYLEIIEQELNSNNHEKVFEILSSLVPEWKMSKNILSLK